jgi:hypothetical protein
LDIGGKLHAREEDQAMLRGSHKTVRKNLKFSAQILSAHEPWLDLVLTIGKNPFFGCAKMKNASDSLNFPR